MSCRVFYIWLLMMFWINCFSQYSIMFESDVEYWEHSDLIGYKQSVSCKYKASNYFMFSGFSFGYGERNRVKDFANYDYDSPATVESAYKFFPKDEELGCARKVTDDAHQLSLNIGIGKDLTISDNLFYTLETSIFLSRITQFYSVEFIGTNNYTDDVIINENYNIIILSDQIFYTTGVELGCSVNYNIRDNKSIGLGLNAAYGINGTSFIGVGVKFEGLLTRWNSSE